MTTATLTRTDRQTLENMVRIETRNLNWQRANDATYADILATLQRILDLNVAIEATGNRSSAYATNNGR